MHDLLEILQHASSLLDGFSQYTFNCMVYYNIAMLLFSIDTFHSNKLFICGQIESNRM